MQKIKVKAFDNEAFSKWCSGKTPFANYELSFLKSCEDGDFNYATMHYKAVNTSVLNISLVAAAMNGQYEFVKRFTAFKNEKRVTVRFWNELQHNFPETYQESLAHCHKNDLYVLMRKYIENLDVAVLDDILTLFPEIENDRNIAEYFERENDTNRQIALLKGHRNFYERMLKYKPDFETEKSTPKFLREDIRLLCQRSPHELPGLLISDLWTMILDQMQPDWDISFVLKEAQDISAIVKYGYRFEDFKSETTDHFIVKRQMNELFSMKDTFNELAKNKTFTDFVHNSCKDDQGNFDFQELATERFNGLSALEVLVRQNRLPEIVSTDKTAQNLQEIYSLLPPHIAKSKAKYFAELAQQYKMNNIKKRVPTKGPLKRRR